MIPNDFPTFVLRTLETEGIVFGAIDFALYERGTRTWRQLKDKGPVPESQLGNLHFTSASELRFVAAEPGTEHWRQPALVYARFDLADGDSYWICMEASLEHLLTRYYGDVTWTPHSAEAFVP